MDAVAAALPLRKLIVRVNGVSRQCPEYVEGIDGLRCPMSSKDARRGLKGYGVVSGVVGVRGGESLIVREGRLNRKAREYRWEE